MSDLLTSLTEPAFLIIVGPVAFIAVLFIWAELRADRIARVRAEETRKTLAYLREQGSVGHESLDDIRREWGAR